MSLALHLHHKERVTFGVVPGFSIIVGTQFLSSVIGHHYFLSSGSGPLPWVFSIVSSCQLRWFFRALHSKRCLTSCGDVPHSGHVSGI